MSIVSSSLKFEQGIEQILIQDSPTPPTLPLLGRELPSEGKIPAQLETILNDRDLENGIVQSLQPRIRHREILSPSEYRNARATIGQALTGALEVANESDQTKLDILLALLNADRDLHALLESNRNVLHRV
ncbi:MAG: hypothetical protein KDA80_20710 [Planctomycetaceae bacterium]|nr:hypothetical protein [Planctomycetaceae bacterium]